MLVLHVYLAVGAHAVVICLMYVNDGLREWVYEALGTLDVVNVNASILLGLRIPGLTYGLASTRSFKWRDWSSCLRSLS